MRATSIDVLRGIAILGILFMNIPYHANMLLGYVPFDPALASDKMVSLLYSIFADGRFRTLFCILFGAGLTIQYENCKRKDVDPALFIKYRLNWLLFFGFIHAVFVFGGDILMLYSLTGLLLLKGLSLDTNELLQKAKKFIFIGCALSLIFALLGIAFADIDELVLRGSEEYLESIELWQGNYWYQTMVHGAFAIGVLFISPLFILWEVLGLMYLGAYLYRINFFMQGFSQPVFIKICVLAVLITLICIFPQLFIDEVSAEFIPLLSSISAVFVALVYAHVIVKLSQSPGVVLSLFIAPGKLAFSLYILQSIVMAIILRWAMPEFNLRATQFDYFVLVSIYTITQIIMANLYLLLFKQGPLELLWRKAYARSISKKLQANASVENSETS